ncbi:MAG: glycosyltransferase family 4 protein [Eubacteriales bacterium]|nr:glycosyltransferase family 4 protein [Eubacteriales bacterium]
MGNKKKNILIVHNYYQIPGGEDTVVANEKKMLEKQGHKVILYSRNNAELKQMSKLQKIFLPITTVFNPRTYRDVKKLIREENIEVVHIHNTLNLVSPAVYYAARRMKVPVIQTIHNFRLLCPGATFYRDGHICEDCVEHGLKCAVKHSCYRGSKIQTLACVLSTVFHQMIGIYGKINYICLTDFNKKKLLELKQIKPERVFIKPNFVESKNEYVPEKDRKNQFVFVGRLDKLKGIDFLFEAWKVMGEEAPKLIVCGTGPMKEWCEIFIRENFVNIEMYGFVPNDEALKIIANSRALVLPTQCYEGFPMSIVEAFSVGTPVICSDLGNAGSVVEEGVTGYKFMANSVDGIICAVEKCHGLCSQTKIVYQENYSAEKNYELISSIYKVI